MNQMREIMLDKVTLNMGAGEPGPKLEKSQKILEKISGKKVVVTRTRKRTTFGGAKKRPIGAMTTVRGEQAKKMLGNMLQAVEQKLSKSCFDTNGNFSFGIKEYIHMPGMKYDPEVGILGLDVAVTLKRRGYRVKDRRIRPGRIGKNHRIKPEESMEWMKKEFGIRIE
jgi:large subunit ribosomal protein L5